MDAQKSFSLQKNNPKSTFFATLAVRLIPINHELSGCGYFAVKLLRIVLHLRVEGLFVAVEFKVSRYSPRVPAATGSPKGHNALGNLFAISTRDDYLRIE